MKHNVIYLHSHDTGRYIAPYGHAIATPNLQRLAEEGVLFRQAFSAAPTCSPSRAALLTGQSAHSSGMLGLAHRGFSLTHPEQHLAAYLKNAGYRTVLAGFQHVGAGGEEEKLGYAEVDRDLPAEEAAAAFLGSSPREPFFLDVGFVETHRKGRGFNEQEPTDAGAHVQVPPVLPDTPEVRSDMASYQVAAERLDHKVGVVLNALEASGLADKTLVIFTTDHGIAFPHMKGTLSDHGIGVALIMRGPGGFAGGKAVDALVSHIDLFPTLSEVLGLPKPEHLEGTSLLPLITGDAQAVREDLFAEVTFHAAFEPKRAVRTRRWKYIRRWCERSRPVLANVDDSPSKDLLLAHGWDTREVAEEALFDLVYDPLEFENLATQDAYQATLQEMRERLTGWMKDTNDPLLTGNLPVPEGVNVNPVDDISPSEPGVPWHNTPEARAYTQDE